MLTQTLPLLGLLAALILLGLTLAALRLELRRERARFAAARANALQWSRALSDAAFDGLLIHRQGQILQMNRALLRLLGARERELLGQPFAHLARPDQAGALRAELEAPRPEIREFCLLHANKSERFVELSSQNIEFDGAPATVTAIRDIGQRLADASTIAGLTRLDRLTGLPNRQIFASSLARALAAPGPRGGTVSVLTLDIDRFKPINAQFGRAGGDALLKQAAQRLLSLTQSEDLLARLGSDKFAVLVASPGTGNRAASLAGQLIAGFAEPFIVEGQLVRLSLSIGIACYPEHAADADALMQASEFALAAAERQGGGRAHHFCHAEKATGRSPVPARPDSGLRQAIASGALHLRFQPVLRLPDLAPSGFAALPFWQHPTHGLLGPDQLFKLATSAGEAAELGTFVLRQALQQAAASRTRITVSLDAAQLADPALPAGLGTALAAAGLDTLALELDIDEALLALPGAAAALAALAATGAGLALTTAGHAESGACQPGLPFARLKLSRRLLETLGSGGPAEARAAAVMARAAQQRLEVAALGVDRPEQLDFLRRHACHAVQGELFGPPLSQLPPAAPHVHPRPAMVVAPP